MSYLRNQKTYLYLGFFLLIMIAAHYRGWLGPLEKSGRSLVIPIVSRLHFLNVQAPISGEFTCDSNSPSSTVNNENKQQLGILGARVNILENENMELKKQIDFKSDKKINLVTTAVLGRSLDTTENTIIIDGGESLGIKVNQPVIAGAGVLVGKVVKVENDIAIVRLINDSLYKISGMIINKDNSLGTVEGGYGLSLRLKFIPRNEVVRVGDSVVTGGLETECPKGLLIGTVAVIENEAYKPFQQAVLTPAVDLARLSIVSVLTQ